VSPSLALTLFRTNADYLCLLVFSLVSCVAAYHGIRNAMHLLKKTGTDFSSAQGMDPKAFFGVMGLDDVIRLDAAAGGNAFKVV
jgi:hypothetical protein